MKLTKEGREQLKRVRQNICPLCVHRYSPTSTICKSCILPIANGNGIVVTKFESKVLNAKIDANRNGVSKKNKKEAKKHE